MDYFKTEHSKDQLLHATNERGPKHQKQLRNTSQTALNHSFSKESGLEFVHILEPNDATPLETPKEDARMISTVMTTIIENYSADIGIMQPTTSIEPHFPVKSVKQEENATKIQGQSQTGLQAKRPLINLTENSWVLQFLNQLFGWIIPLASTSETRDYIINDKELWRDWEWVLSKTEEIVQKQNEAESERIKYELESLKNASTSLKFKSRFLGETKILFAELSLEQLAELAIDLDSSKKSKIISDIVQKNAQDWQNFIQINFFLSKTLQTWINYSNGYLEKPYDKGIMGSAKELAFSASHGTKSCGLNEKVLAEILWAIWKTLIESLRNIGCEIDDIKASLLADEICKCKLNFIHLWISTVKNSRNGTKKEGILVQRWKEEEEVEELRMSKILETKGTDAKYVTPSKYTSAHCKEKKEMNDIKKFLEQRLSFYIS